MIRPLKITHTSDVHLTDEPDGVKVREAFSQVVDTVLDTNSDLFLIAGDLFDHNEIQRKTVDFVYEQLARVSCPTVVIVGNHDVWDERSIVKRMDFRKAGKHVTLLDDAQGTQVTFPELHATVWGRCMLDHDRSNKPMAGAPSRKHNLWHIGMAHGLYDDEPDTDRSSLITPQEIAASGFDYLALGHVHAHRQMRHGDTLACYPGVCAAHMGTLSSGCVALATLMPGKGARVVAHTLRGNGKQRRSA
ncbi:MAG: DNA repair exonuclease [Burkholderiales bacterium]